MGKLSDISAHQDGSYKTTLTAGKATDLVTVNALLDGEPFKSTAVKLKPWTASPNSMIVPVPSSITANGIEESTITVTLVDDRNQRITSNQSVTLTLMNAQFGDKSQSKDITCYNGVGTAVITSATPGTATITAQVDQIMLDPTHVQVIFGKAASQKSTFEILADHRTVGVPISLSLQLKDEHGHPISGKTARGKISGIPEISEVIFTEKRAGSGIYTAEITSTIAGTATINATVDGQPIATQEITFTPGPVDANTSKIELSKSTITADNQDPLTITIKPYDAYGNVVATIPTDKIHLDFAGDDLGTKLDSVTAHQDGTYTATLTAGTKKGRLTVTASGDGKMIKSPFILLGEWRANTVKSKLTISPTTITANGEDKADITLTLIDGKGQPVTSAKDIKLLITEGEELGAQLSPVMNHQNGTYTATLTAGTQEGELTVYAFADKILVKSTILNLSKWQIDTSYSQVTVSPQKITANGKDSSTITINLRDDKNQPITVERSVGVTLTNAQFNDETQSTVIPCRDGNGTAEITSTTPGTATITAKVDQTTLARATVQVTKQLVDPISSYAEVLRKPHGGVDALTITVYLNDSSHQPVSSEANSILIQRVYSSARHQGEFYGRFSEMNSQGPQIMLQEIDTGKYTHAPIAYPNSSSE